MALGEITLEDFKKIPKGQIFRVVITNAHHVLMIGDKPADLTFVCKKGNGYDNWAIYYGFSAFNIRSIAEQGEKLTLERSIRAIFPCTDEVYNLYRW